MKAGLDVDAFAGRLSFFFNAHNNLLEEVAKFRAARSVLGPHHEGAVQGEGPSLDDAPLPHPDGGIDAHRSATRQQRRARDDPGARRGPRRDPVTPHQFPRRGARSADRGLRADRAPHPADPGQRIPAHGVPNQVSLRFQVHLRHTSALAQDGNQAGRNFFEESRPRGPLLLASAETPPVARPTEVEALLGARHAYIAQPPLFLEHAVRVDRAAVRAEPVLQAGQEHGRKLEPFGVVHRHQHHLGLLVQSIRIRNQGHVVQKVRRGLPSFHSLSGTALASSPRFSRRPSDAGESSRSSIAL